MSELKARHVVDVYDNYAEHPCEDYSQVYLKSEADKVIAELEEERRWRKCSDEMPEDGAEVLASDGVGIWLCYKTTLSDGSPWFQPDGLPHIEGVTHWMPLPSAPKETDK
jgi:hypothetical protein